MYIDKFIYIYVYIYMYTYVKKRVAKMPCTTGMHCHPGHRTCRPPESFSWTVSAPVPPSTAGYTPICFKMVHVNDSAAPKEFI